MGPLFYLNAKVPADWQREFSAFLPDAQIPVLTEYGAGYVIEVYGSHLRDRLATGQLISLFIAQVLREDSETLFAFESAQERSLFLEVKDIKDIGPKTAAAAVGMMGARGLMDLTVGRDWTGPKIPGLGAKTLDSLKFGLGKKKEKLIKLLSLPSARTISGGEIETPSLSGSIPRSIRLGLEGLGMPGSAALKLYSECLNESANFSELEDAEKLQVMLRRWGQLRMRGAIDL